MLIPLKIRHFDFWGIAVILIAAILEIALWVGGSVVIAILRQKGRDLNSASLRLNRAFVLALFATLAGGAVVISSVHLINHIGVKKHENSFNLFFEKFYINIKNNNLKEAEKFIEAPAEEEAAALIDEIRRKNTGGYKIRNFCPSKDTDPNITEELGEFTATVYFTPESEKDFAGKILVVRFSENGWKISGIYPCI